ncbi:MAG: NADP-dependent oxidoreductase [Rhodospirillaceae bacterium]|jgi:NADPH:quinone reductase|nr:NADP-dependent oxidoreductase [Rhodospirillaceae bacterium]MBT4045765.1 NADP-dependent oxidoreductase [Rhodospirillaceae bacterium]MBT4690972.1 NADP-dependent oxidoreductase [Rhodospirillaceae bacterium]MBT5079974.1 NADP-dependent oxidoreductase [Rhodospirillaceae bacterium]MBT5525996.1 NADP-dependent oxidoreductase [Rhodospirillaceae bacterium]
MRAVGLLVHGGPEVLQVVQVPEVQAGPGQVRIHVHAAAVNPTDTMARNGSRAEQQKVDPPPYVPGMDAAGIVDQVGEGVSTGVQVGDAVMAMVVPNGSHGAYREQIVLEARAVVPAPAGTTHAEACTLPMNGLTARLSLDLLGLESGQTLAVTGAAGAYGGYVIQLAKAEGLTVIADASEADEALVASLGADIVVRRGDDVADRIREHFPNGVDGLADGAVQNDLVIPALRDGGVFTAVRGFEGEAERGIKFTATWVRTYDCEFEKLDRLRQQAEDGVITLRVAEIYPADRAAETHRRLEAGGTRGRLVIEF